MLRIHDLRDTRVYQEALKEGKKEGLARAIVNLAAKNMPAEEIAAILELEMELVRKVLGNRTKG